VPRSLLVLLLSSLPLLVAAQGCSDSASPAAVPPVADGGDGGELPPPPQTEDGGPSGVDAGDASDGGDKAASSGGSGGLACTRTGNLGGGRTYCVATRGGSELKLAVPAGGSGALRLALYLHGDGAGAYKSDGAMKALITWADAHHALVVSVLAPNACAWWQAPTQTDCTPNATPVPDAEGVNADALRAVIDAVRGAYDVSNGPVFYYGSSGGSIFLTRSFLRRFGDRYPGVFALNCGGEKADRAFAWDVASSTLRGSTKLYFTYGDQDFLKADIEEAIPYYGGVGFPTATKVIAGAAHCAFDGHGRAAEVWSTFLGE